MRWQLAFLALVLARGECVSAPIMICGCAHVCWLCGLTPGTGQFRPWAKCVV